MNSVQLIEMQSEIIAQQAKVISKLFGLLKQHTDAAELEELHCKFFDTEITSDFGKEYI